MSRFIDSFNKGDVKTAEATHTADVVIIDEVPPHRWIGPGAFQAWAGDLEKDGKANGMTNERVTLGKPNRVQVDGDTAYVVVPATFLYKKHGKPMKETAHFAVSLIDGADGWKINGWAWAGTIPQAAVAKPAAPAPAATPPAAK
jgi:ketosteroid isomerase-like protein